MRVDEHHIVATMVVATARKRVKRSEKARGDKKYTPVYKDSMKQVLL